METFPFKYKYITLEELHKRFNNLKEYKGEFVVSEYLIWNIPQLKQFDLMYYPNHDYCILKGYDSDWFSMNEVSDYFIEDVRAFAQRYDTDVNMIEFWEAHKDELESKFKDVEPEAKRLFETREEISRLYKEVGSFRPAVLCGILEHFKSARVLDFSSGWGDRLIACLAKGVELYIGVDPNPDLPKRYQAIQNEFNKDGKTRVKMIESPFEELPKCGSSNSPLEKVDLVFTSPPYFDLEVYTKDSKQSHHYGDKWFDKFLSVALKNAWLCLVPKGKMIIVINNIKGKDDFVCKMVKYVNTFHDSKYLGVISYSNFDDKGKPKSPQPMWIWEKLNKPLVPKTWYGAFEKVTKPLAYTSTGTKYHLEVARLGKWWGLPVTIYIRNEQLVNWAALMMGARYVLTNDPRLVVSQSTTEFKVPYDLISPTLKNLRIH